MRRFEQTREMICGMRSTSFLVRFILLSVLATVSLVEAHGSERDCGELINAYGPFDYTNPVHVRDKLKIVETHHFTTQVETLERGQTGAIELDIDYTLRAFPNHHRALNAMLKLQLRNGFKPGVWRFSAECYFDRALRMKPDDGIARMLFGIYLHKQGRYDEAVPQYKKAIELNPENAEIRYNIGLLYVDMKDYASARKYASEAYDMGYPFPGLKQRLKKAGYWDE